jgi:hypothetical protein
MSVSMLEWGHSKITANKLLLNLAAPIVKLYRKGIASYGSELTFVRASEG